jgi:hypothetical protein
VETEGTKLPTPPVVMSNQSLTTAPGTEIFDAETGVQNPQFRLLETDTETRRDSKSPVLAELARKKRTEFDPYDWVVEVIGLELETHHPVIEPVSASRRERKFLMQRQAGKQSPSPARDRS